MTANIVVNHKFISGYAIERIAALLASLTVDYKISNIETLRTIKRSSDKDVLTASMECLSEETKYILTGMLAIADSIEQEGTNRVGDID